MIVEWISVPSVCPEARAANAVIVRALGLPKYRGAGRLAIVGGGPSINSHVEELRSWSGQIWAVNGAVNWCLDQGIDAHFYTVDAAKAQDWFCDFSRVRKAVLAPDCDPSLFERLSGAQVSLTMTPDGGPTSAAAADLLALDAGHDPIVWFGCEASFAQTTHAFETVPVDAWVSVRIGGELYRTKPEFIGQAKIMSEVIRTFPRVYSERSGGLLRAMVEHGPGYDIEELSPAIRATIKEKAA